MPISTISSKGQVTIPADIRKRLNLQSGDKINFLIDEEGKVSFLPATKSVTALKGIVPAPKKAVSLAEIEDTIKRKGASRDRN